MLTQSKNLTASNPGLPKPTTKTVTKQYYKKHEKNYNLHLLDQLPACDVTLPSVLSNILQTAPVETDRSVECACDKIHNTWQSIISLWRWQMQYKMLRSVGSWVKKVGWAGSCNFPTDSSKFVTEEIMGAQNFNFVPNFSKMGVFGINFAFLDHKFQTKGKFLDSTKFRRGGGNYPCRDATGCGLFSVN